MPRLRKGFTLIEVTLVIALTAMIFVAFIGSVGGAIAAKRYNDSAINFAEFLRNQYSAVINVQSGGSGNTTQAIYGRLITFGEQNSDTVYSYDIIGNAYSSDQLGGNKSIISALKTVEAAVVIADNTGAAGCHLRPVNEDSYNLTHGAWLETTSPRGGLGSGTRFEGSILIVRSPVSGTVSTLYSPTTIKVKEALAHSCVSTSADLLGTKPGTPGPHALDNFTTQQVDFCIGSDDQPRPNVRRDIRLAKNGSNASAVQLIGQESGDNLCNS